MLFNSYEFLFGYFPAVLLGSLVLGRRHPQAAVAFLAAASLFFYGWWSVQALPLLLTSITVNYLLGGLVAPGGRYGAPARRRLLHLALALNLALLGVFKYADFLVANTNLALAALGSAPWPALHWLLPIGISFYTFTQIAYLVDSWRGQVRERRFVHYLLFVSYFPHLIAGPILHHAQLMPQFARARSFVLNPRRLLLGLALFVLGLSKKLLIADPLGQCADLVFGAVHDGLPPSPQVAWTGVLAYTFQIYFDFSGYSDMAIGISRCLGVRLPENFRSPYQATSIIEFWRRWHMSLSAFLRDYLYIPLGGNRLGASRRQANLMITMVLGGLWHGAAWTFVCWGAIHGAALVLNHAWIEAWQDRPGTAPCAPTPTPAPWHRLGRAAGGLATFAVVCLAWVVFRSPDIETALAFYRGMAGLVDAPLARLADLDPPFDVTALHVTLADAALIAWLLPRSRQIVAAWWPVPRRWSRAAPWRRCVLALAMGLGLGLLLTCSVYRLGVYSPFLYFQF